ncbi:MAG TPA: hypothetical protein VMB21_17220 [Candidatus Limnocylindria bacterium]|jgi:hypothetical protein|nr:hypothetical protein [Candidatus Limnocylindria bacterium]
MSLTTVEVELVHGQVIPCGRESLPERATALLTILTTKTGSHDPLSPHPALGKAVFHEDPAKPLQPGDWPEALV